MFSKDQWITFSSTNQSIFSKNRSKDCWMTFSSTNRSIFSKERSVFSKGHGLQNITKTRVLTQTAPHSSLYTGKSLAVLGYAADQARTHLSS